MNHKHVVTAIVAGLTIGLPSPPLAHADDEGESPIQHTIIVYHENPSVLPSPAGYCGAPPGIPAPRAQTPWRWASHYPLANTFFPGMPGPPPPAGGGRGPAPANTVGDPNPAGDVCNDYGGPFMPQQD